VLVAWNPDVGFRRAFQRAARHISPLHAINPRAESSVSPSTTLPASPVTVHRMEVAPTPRHDASSRYPHMADALDPQSQCAPPLLLAMRLSWLGRRFLPPCDLSIRHRLAQRTRTHSHCNITDTEFNRLLSLFLISSYDDEDGIHDHHAEVWEGIHCTIIKAFWDRRNRKIPSSPINHVCRHCRRRMGERKGGSRETELGISGVG